MAIKIATGQKVWVLETSHSVCRETSKTILASGRVKQYTIKKVGRTYFYIEDSKFRIDTLELAPDSRRMLGKIYESKEAIQEQYYLGEIRWEVQEFFRRWDRQGKMLVEDYEAVLKIINARRETKEND